MNRSPNRIFSFRFAFSGIWHMLRTQENAWIHSIVTVVVIGTGLWLGLSRLEWAMLLLAIGLVWASEFANTAIEAVIDLTSPEIHPLAKVSKDLAAGGVLVAAIVSAIVGLIVLGPPLWAKIGLLISDF